MNILHIKENRMKIRQVELKLEVTQNGAFKKV